MSQQSFKSPAYNFSVLSTLYWHGLSVFSKMTHLLSDTSAELVVSKSGLLAQVCKAIRPILSAPEHLFYVR